MKSSLIYKLLAINLAVIGFVMAVVWLSIDTLAAGYFVELMENIISLRNRPTPCLSAPYIAT